MNITTKEKSFTLITVRCVDPSNIVTGRQKKYFEAESGSFKVNEIIMNGVNLETLFIENSPDILVSGDPEKLKECLNFRETPGTTYMPWENYVTLFPFARGEYKFIKVKGGVIILEITERKSKDYRNNEFIYGRWFISDDLKVKRLRNINYDKQRRVCRKEVKITSTIIGRRITIE